MWFGASSRVALPVAKTDESLSKVTLPSGFGYSRSGPMNSGTVASSCVAQWPPGTRPPEMVIMLASAPPTKKPFANGWRAFRVL